MTLGDVEHLDWDSNVRDHLQRHRIDLTDVEDVLFSAVVCVPDRGRPGDRWKIIGHTLGGRALTVVCSYDEVRRALRPITGWDVTPGERARYIN